MIHSVGHAGIGVKAHKADQNEGTHKDGDFTGMLSLVLAGTLTGRMRWIAKRLNRGIAEETIPL